MSCAEMLAKVEALEARLSYLESELNAKGEAGQVKVEIQRIAVDGIKKAQRYGVIESPHRGAVDPRLEIRMEIERRFGKSSVAERDG